MSIQQPIATMTARAHCNILQTREKQRSVDAMRITSSGKASNASVLLGKTPIAQDWANRESSNLNAATLISAGFVVRVPNNTKRVRS